MKLNSRSKCNDDNIYHVQTHITPYLCCSIPIGCIYHISQYYISFYKHKVVGDACRSTTLELCILNTTSEQRRFTALLPYTHMQYAMYRPPELCLRSDNRFCIHTLCCTFWEGSRHCPLNAGAVLGIRNEHTYGI